jgi:CheY-like chemotaxis protein
VVGLADTLDRALAMARDADIDAAVLDVNLNGQDSFAAAQILSDRHVPFVFATGYGSKGLADRFRAVPTLTKPYQRDDLDRALRQAMAVTGNCSKAKRF